jgi:hypothetical protein
MTMKDDDALTHLNALRGSPLKYLKERRIVIGGGDRGGKSGDQSWGIDYKLGSTDVVFFNANATTKPLFKAHAVAMHCYDGKKTPASKDALGALASDKLPFYELNDKGSDLMMTGQLTFCAFVMLKKGNRIFCTHVEPGKDAMKTGADLDKELSAKGLFDGHTEKLVVFGKTKYPDPDVAYIVGVRTSGKWAIYAQLRPKSDDSKPITKSIQLI